MKQTRHNMQPHSLHENTGDSDDHRSFSSLEHHPHITFFSSKSGFFVDPFFVVPFISFLSCEQTTKESTPHFFSREMNVMDLVPCVFVAVRRERRGVSRLYDDA